VFHNVLAHGPGLARRRIQVHQQARARIHFHNGAPLGFQGLADVFRHQIHPGDVQTDDAGGQGNGSRHIRMDLVGAVEGHIAVALDQHPFTGGRHGVLRVAVALQFQPGGGIQAHEVEGMLFRPAPAGVRIELGVDQFVDGGLAVPGHPGQFPLGGGDHLVPHHQEPVFRAQDVVFHDDAATFIRRHPVGRLHLVLGQQVGENPPAVIAVRGFDHHGQADVFRRLPGFLLAVHQHPFGHRHTAGLEQGLGQILIPGNAFRNGAGPVRFRRPDAPLPGTVAQLH